VGVEVADAVQHNMMFLRKDPEHCSVFDGGVLVPASLRGRASG